MTKKFVFLSVALIFVLACQAAGIATQAPAEAPQQAVEPSFTETEEPEEPTAIPPTNTPVPEPTATPVPQSGDLLYETTFDDLNSWEAISRDTLASYEFESRSDGVLVKVPDRDDYLYAYYDLGPDSNDVRLEADVELVGGNNYTYIALVCRSSDKGEYVFFLDTGGYWQIGKWDFETEEYEQLGYGGSTRIQVAKHPNHMSVTCEGNELTFLINGHTVGSVTDDQFSEGAVGIGVETFDYPLTEVVFHKLEIFIP